MAVKPSEFYDSFLFGGVNMLQDWGIRGYIVDGLIPAKKTRRVDLPGRDGVYDFGSTFYKNRALKVRCDTMRGHSRDEIRRLARVLSTKSRIVFWNEPEKYYLGELQNQIELTYLGRAGHAFELVFDCDPFAYGASVEKRWAGATGNVVGYAGTARTPAVLTVKNTGASPIQGLTITIRQRL